MTITSARAISYRAMEKWKQDPDNSPIGMWTPRFDNLYIIHITDPGAPLLFRDSDKIITLQFEDIDPARYNFKHVQFGSKNRLFNGEDAKKIFDFLKKAQSVSDTNDGLLVNCMAGISRSGATIDFARVYCGLPYDEFQRLNPRIVPNAFVRKQLLDKWQEDENPEPARYEDIADETQQEDDKPIDPWSGDNR